MKYTSFQTLRLSTNKYAQIARCLSLSLFAAAFLTACSSNNDDSSTQGQPALDGESNLAGFIYTTTNGEGTNQVIKLDRYSDGSTGNELAYTTNSAGGANTSAGGDARGDFDSQNAIQIVGDYLLNVNAGGNTVSVFFIDRPTGGLTLLGNTDSGGVRPVSITYAQKAPNDNNYWVVVANQWNNPNVQKDGENIERYPNDAFHSADLTLPDDTDAVRNISLFSFDATNGALDFVNTMDTYVRENGGPSAATFSDDGTKLAVTTWGIAHFGTENTSLSEQHASRVYVYDFDNGTVSGERFFEEEGIAGSIGLNWARNSNDTLHISNFNLIPTKRDHSLTVLSDDGINVVKIDNHNTGGLDDIDEACWTLLNSAGNKLYVSSFGANLISAFDIDASGNVVSDASVTSREGNAPPGDTKDMYISSDNKYLYNLGAFQSFSINRFDISDTGITYVDQTDYVTTSASIGNTGFYNFLGITGYDL